MDVTPSFGSSPENQDQSHQSVNFEFHAENLEDIPCPDDVQPSKTDFLKRSNPPTSLLYSEDFELPPLPPETINNSVSTQPESLAKNVTIPTSNFIPPAQIPLPQNSVYQNTNSLPSHFTPPLPSSADSQVEGSCFNLEKNAVTIKKQDEYEAKNFIDCTKYSPSKLDSDEENQDFSSTKPKVLGKEQAKKRLMAFSLSKQANTPVKKQNKILANSKSIKEKPPNPNKGSGVQEQFRATISEIEEEKRKMMQNMPNYLLLEMSDLAKSTHPIITSSLKLLEKYKMETADENSTKVTGKKDGTSSKKSNDQQNQSSRDSSRKSNYSSSNRNRSYRRSRSRSPPRKYSSRSRRSRDSSKTRKRSRSRSPTRKNKEEKSMKDESRNESYTPNSKEVPEDWKSLKTGPADENEINSRLQNEETRKQRDSSHKRLQSPNDDRWVYKPIFNYLKKESKVMTTFQARPADPGSDVPILYQEKKIKYTKTKPMLIWSENPSCATEFYMSKQMLLDNCDSTTASILRTIMDSENVGLSYSPVKKMPRSRLWYPSTDFLQCEISNLYDDMELDPPQEFEKSLHRSESALKSLEAAAAADENKRKLKKKKDESDKNDNLNFNKKEYLERKSNSNSKEKRLNLVNDSYLSDEESNAGKIKEMVVGDVKVQLDLDLNCVKVRSRWDSDYEGDNSEKEAPLRQEIKIKRNSIKDKIQLGEIDFGKPEAKSQEIFDTKITDSQNSLGSHSAKDDLNSQINSTDSKDNLASEYEEFLKMVSFDSVSDQPVQTQEKAPGACVKSDKQKTSKTEKCNEEIQKPKFEMTDWDKESDHEEKSMTKKLNFDKNESGKQLIELVKDDKTSLKKKKIKKSIPQKKKLEKKVKKQKLLKKTGKTKKKRVESSSSSDSSSESYDSASDSDSDDSRSSGKKKKLSKTKKRYRKDSSSSESDSESDSDSDDSKSSKKKKAKRKKDKKKKKKKKSDSSDSEDDKQNALLKQLDFKKQFIMKKIEEIDSISERSDKKKRKEGKQKRKEKDSLVDADDEALEKFIKSMKKKKVNVNVKGEKSKKKVMAGLKSEKTAKETRRSNLSSDSDDDDDSSTEKIRKKKEKTGGKKFEDTSESSDSDDNKNRDKSQSKDRLPGIKSLKSIEKSFKKSKKIKKEKKRYYSSESKSDDSSSKEMKSVKKKVMENQNKESFLEKENSHSSWKDNFLLEDNFEGDRKQMQFDEEKLKWKPTGGTTLDQLKEKGAEADNWEASSSMEESPQDSRTRESWDDDVPSGNSRIDVPHKILERKETSAKESSDKVPVESDATLKSVPGCLKSSLSNFSFNENSFCGFGQELSRDFFLTDPSFSNLESVNGSQAQSNLGSCTIESRPFQSVTQSSEPSNPSKSELYSPGYSDSSESDADEKAKPEKANSNAPKEAYDPLKSGSESSQETNQLVLGKIPLPQLSDILLPGEYTNFKGLESLEKASTAVSVSNDAKDEKIMAPNASDSYPFSKSSFISTEFSPLDVPKSSPLAASLPDTPTKISAKKQVISMKSQQKLMSKAASVFQDESDEEVTTEKAEPNETAPTSNAEDLDKENKNTEENLDRNRLSESKRKESDSANEKVKEESRKYSKGVEVRCERSRERSEERRRKRRRSSSRERRSSTKSSREKSSLSSRRRRSKTPEKISVKTSKEKREIRSDSFEIEPLKSATEFNELGNTVQPIPVLTGLGAASDRSDRKTWNPSPFLGYASAELSSATGDVIDPSDSFDIYPSEDPKYRNHHFDNICATSQLTDSTDKSSSDKSATKEDKKKERRHSRSRSHSPRKRRRSKSPEKRKSPRNRSPRRRSSSPKRRDKSPYSPRRRSPKRRYRGSRSPDRRRKSRSRSPRKRRTSPSRRSHSLSPRKQRSPKRRDSPRRRGSPSRTYSPRKSLSPRRDNHYSHYPSSYHNRIPVIGAAGEDLDRELSPSKVRETPMGFPHMSGEQGLDNSFYHREYSGDFPVMNYPEEVGGNNLITVKSHDLEKPNSPERLSLDQRIELELGVPMGGSDQSHGDQYQGCKGPFQDINSIQFQNSYEGTTAAGENFYPSQNAPVNSDFNSQYYNGHQPQTGYGPFQQYPNSQPVQNSMLQVGNIVEVVPTMQHSLSASAPAKNSHQIMQVGNVLQVVPSQKTSQTSPMPFSAVQNYGTPSSTSPIPPVKTQKATAVVAPSSIVPTPNPETVMNPLIKAIQLEREKRKKEKEKRKLEREERRKARQLRREAKLLSVNEKLKKSVQDEGLMLGQEVEDEELLDGLDLPSPPIPVEIITVSSPSALPPAGKGILITAGFMPKPPSEKKEVKFADGVCPGEGTSSSGEEDVISPPPKPKLPKENRFKKKKTKVKKKVKVQIIRQIIQDEGDDEYDDLSPPPPPPGDPPPVYFARFPFAGDAQFPVYQTQTTASLTTVQYPGQSF